MSNIQPYKLYVNTIGEDTYFIGVLSDVQTLEPLYPNRARFLMLDIWWNTPAEKVIGASLEEDWINEKVFLANYHIATPEELTFFKDVVVGKMLLSKSVEQSIKERYINEFWEF